MPKDNKENNENKKDKRRRKNNIIKSLKIFSVIILLSFIIGGGVLAGIVISIIKEAPEIDPTKITSSLSQTSTIYDSNEKLIEKIDTGEYRTFVSLSKMPKHLTEAFIAIEDERFEEHRGIDPRGIAGSLIENLKSDGIVRGASTITQQLVKNVYLTNEQNLTRKIKEAYLALQVEKVLHKDQILEAYLNNNFFGQNAAGVQEAAQTYFSKNVEDLTLAESALFAGVIKSPTHYQPFIRVRPQDYDSKTQDSVGEINVLGEKYILVFNEKSVERQKIVLKKMFDLGKITQAEYKEALKENIKDNLKPGQKKLEDITSYFTDYVKNQVVTALVHQLDYTKEEAEETLYKGGLKIYSTIDLALQKELENIYHNFTETLVGNPANIRGPILIDWKLNNFGNIVDDTGRIIYYKKVNLLDEDDNLIILNGNYSIADNGDITITDNKLTAYPKHIDIADYYTIDERKNLVTHSVGSFDISEDDFKLGANNEVIITKSFLDKQKDFLEISSKGNLIISGKYFYNSIDGIVQPQSSSVILDYKTGHIKAVVGGRDVEGNRILNRATSAPRQPGSVIKPLAAYLPALDNGYTAATAIDDIPFYDGSGKLWPKNNYSGYKGMRTLRSALEDSGNVPSVKTVENIGIETSISYLDKLGIVNKKNGEKDNFVKRSSDPNYNDENLAALGLGGMTHGLTPLEVTAAYGAIANGGIYMEPIAFTKIVDRDGNVLLENTPRETTVVSPQVAYIMADVLRTNVAEGIGTSAKLSNMVAAGKTGTTQDRADIWFVGFTPYYATGVWIGNDSPKITLNQGSTVAASFWKHIMNRAHQGLEPRYSFNQPPGIITANVCTQSGKLASTLCAQDPRHVIRSEIFATGTVPTEYCDIHTYVTVDTSTGKIANEYCPQYLVSSRVYIQRIPPYKPWENQGIIPRDYAYNAPTGICTLHGPHNTGPMEPTPDEDEDGESPIPENNEDNDTPSTKPEDNNNGSSKPNDSTKPENNNNDSPKP